jgi:cell wall-associated NlpC family hydrolase
MKFALLLLLAAAPAEPPGLRNLVEAHLGRPYVWGATGLKSYDCSGFVWRVMEDSGLYMKRTTARKLFFSLPEPPAGQRWKLGSLVFFDHLQHVGLVEDSSAFFHAESRIGTRRSRFDPYWRNLISGFRAWPGAADGR